MKASFTGWSLVMPGSEQDYVGWQNYTDVLGSQDYRDTIRVTLIYTFGAVSCELVLGTCLALLLNTAFFWRGPIRSMMMIPMVVTPAVVGIFWKLLYDQENGVFNWVITRFGLPRIEWLNLNMALPSAMLMDVWQTTPFFMLVLLAGLQTIDESLLGAARVDGAGPWQVFRYITLPHLVPYMLIAAAFRIIAAMGDFDKIYLLTGGGPGNVTTTMSIYAYLTGFSTFDIGRTSAIAWIFVLIVTNHQRSVALVSVQDCAGRPPLRMLGRRAGSWRKPAMTVLWMALLFVYLFPYTWMVMTGFRKPIDTLTMPPKMIFSPTLDGFRYIFQTTHFQIYLLHSIFVATTATFCVIALATPAAYALAHLRMRTGAFLFAVLVARMVPGIAIVVPVYLIARRLGQLDTFHVLIVIYTAFNLPFAIWLLRSFFREIHSELREAAMIDGGSEFSVFRRVMLPLVAGGIVATSVFVFIAAWNEFLFALVLTNSHAATAPLATLGFRNEFGIQWGAIGAAALLISTPVIAFAVLMQRYLVRGLTMGSIK